MTEPITDPITPEQVIDEMRSFIAAHRWTFARSMPDQPHEYTLRKHCEHEIWWEAIVQLIRDHGTRERYGPKGYSYVYLTVDNWRYWTMGWPVAETTVINRAKVDDAQLRLGDTP
jgi:hypothetical protein